MSTKFRGLAAVFTICVGLAGHAFAADVSIQIDGIEGDSEHHPGEIEIQSYSWGVTNAGAFGSGGGGGAGKASFSDLSFIAEMSKASPKLLEACATGKHIPRAILSCRKTGSDQQEFLMVTLEDILVTSYQTSGTGGDHAPVPVEPTGKPKDKKHPPEPVAPPTVPLDSISLNFTKITYSYRAGDELVEFSFDLESNSSL